MKISILLPYKENFSDDYAGAVSLYVKDITKHSVFKKNIFIYGDTPTKNTLLKNFIHLNSDRKFNLSKTKSYVKEFMNKEKKKDQI